jgi:archaellum component FlaD/FlaE
LKKYRQGRGTPSRSFKLNENQQREEIKEEEELDEEDFPNDVVSCLINFRMLDFVFLCARPGGK